MSQAQTTICPKCGTGFQVSAQQLSKANGKVRCGACLTIFIVSDNMAGAAKNAAVVKKRETDIPSFANDDDDASMMLVLLTSWMQFDTTLGQHTFCISSLPAATCRTAVIIFSQFMEVLGMPVLAGLLLVVGCHCQ